MSTVHALRPARTPGRPGPGPLPAALLRKVNLTVRRRIDGLLAGDHRSWASGDGTELAQVRPVRARRRRPPDRLERDRAHRRAARPRQRRRAGGRDVAPARHLGVDDLRHRRPAEVGRRRRRLARGRPLRRPPRQPARARHLRRPQPVDLARHGRATAACSRSCVALRREPDLEPAGPTSLGAALARIGTPGAASGGDRRRLRLPRPARLAPAAAPARAHATTSSRSRSATRASRSCRTSATSGSSTRSRAGSCASTPAAASCGSASATRPRRSAAELARELRSLGVPHLTLSTSGDWLRRLVGFLQTEGRRR